MTIPLITGNFDVSQSGINNLVNKVNIALGAVVQFQNLTGAITSIGAATSLGSFTSLQLKTALTDETGSGLAVFATSPTLVAPALGTPISMVGTNITGTASAFNIGGNAATATLASTVTTNANLTGPIASVGNATSITSQTGTGTKFVVDNTPTLITPVLGVATATSLNKMAITAPATSSTLAVADGKTLTASNTMTLSGTDGVTMNVTNSKVRTIGFSVSSASLATGQQGGYVVVPVGGTITGWSICANAGTATVTTWKIANGTAVPTVANSISTSGVSLATGTAIESTTVSDFTSTTVTAGDIFAFNLSAVSGVTTLQFQLQITVT